MSVYAKKKTTTLWLYFQDCDKETRVYYNAYSALSLNNYFLKVKTYRKVAEIVQLVILGKEYITPIYPLPRITHCKH